MRGNMKSAAALLLASAALMGCDNTPDFVRFDRGEIVSVRVMRAPGDPCRVVIWIDHRSYSGQLNEQNCTKP